MKLNKSVSAQVWCMKCIKTLRRCFIPLLRVLGTHFYRRSRAALKLRLHSV